MKKSKKEIVDNIDLLTKEVNKCDKLMGVKLKTGDPYKEPKIIYEISSMNANNYLGSVIAVLNGIDPEIYFSKDENERIYVYGYNDIEFVDLSDLEWEKDNKYPVDSLMFKKRFLTSYLLDMISRIDKLTINKYNNSVHKVGFYEHRYFYLKEIISDIRTLVLCMVNEKDYQNILLANILNTQYLKKKNNYKVNKLLYGLITNLKDGMKTTILEKESFMSDDMIIYSLLKIAYILCTGLSNVDVIPKFKYIEGATRNDDLIKLIDELGAQIYSQKDYYKRPIIYEAYNRANPMVVSNYTDANDNWYRSIGIRALNYTSFVLNDKKCTKFIYDMTHDK